MTVATIAATDTKTARTIPHMARFDKLLSSENSERIKLLISVNKMAFNKRKQSIRENKLKLKLKPTLIMYKKLLSYAFSYLDYT